MHVLFSKATCDYIQSSLFSHSGCGEQPSVLTLLSLAHPSWTMGSMNRLCQPSPWAEGRSVKKLKPREVKWLVPSHSFIHFTDPCEYQLCAGFCTIPAGPHYRGEFQSRIYNLKYRDQRGFFSTTLRPGSPIYWSPILLKAQENLIPGDLDCRTSAVGQR